MNEAYDLRFPVLLGMSPDIAAALGWLVVVALAWVIIWRGYRVFARQVASGVMPSQARSQFQASFTWLVVVGVIVAVSIWWFRDGLSSFFGRIGGA